MPFATSLAEHPGGMQGVSFLARHLLEAHKFVAPIYLAPDANRGRLIGRPCPA